MNQKSVMNRKRGIHATISGKNFLKLNLLAYEFGSNPSKVLESLLNEAPDPVFWIEYQAALERMIEAGQDPVLSLNHLVEAVKTGQKVRGVDW